MKIGVYDPYLDTLSGGEKYILSLALCLARHHNVFLFWDINMEEDIKLSAEKKFGFDLNTVSFTRNIFSKKVSTLSRIQQSRFFDAVVVLSDGSIPLVACKLFLHFQTPMEWVKSPDLKTKLKLRRVSKVICNSNFTKRYIDKKFGVNSVVLYPPIHVKEEVETAKENIILNVGRFGVHHAGSSYKKQDFLVGTFIKMVDKGLKNWKLVVIISTPEEDKPKLDPLKETIKKYPIEIVENPKNNVLWEYYAKSKIYWHAAGYGEDLEKHPDRAEHFGMATVEAMGCGSVPVVVNAGGQKEIVQDGENGFLWDSQEELIEKTNFVVSDKNLFENLSVSAQKTALDFGKQRFYNDLMLLIK